MGHIFDPVSCFCIHCGCPLKLILNDPYLLDAICPGSTHDEWRALNREQDERLISEKTEKIVGRNRRTEQ